MIPVPVPGFDLSQRRFPGYWRTAASALIMGPDGQLILQQRDEHAPSAPNMIACPGGGHEGEETLTETLVRELEEELLIAIDPAEPVLLGAIERQYRKMTKLGLVARFFWHDREGRVRETIEGALVTFASAADALAQPSLTFGTRWTIEEALRRGLVK